MPEPHAAFAGQTYLAAACLRPDVQHTRGLLSMRQTWRTIVHWDVSTSHIAEVCITLLPHEVGYPHRDERAGPNTEGGPTHPHDHYGMWPDIDQSCSRSDVYLPFNTQRRRSRRRPHSTCSARQNAESESCAPQSTEEAEAPVSRCGKRAECKPPQSMQQTWQWTSKACTSGSPYN